VASNAPALALDDITCRFAGRDGGGAYTAVANATLNVAAGEFVSVVGPTGCGKSTLLNVAAGLLAPSSGTISVFGEPLVASNGVNRRAGYMFQADALMPWRTGIDNVIAGLENPIQARLDIGPFPDNSFDDGSAPDLVFDLPDGKACTRRHAIGPCLEFAIGETLGLWWRATGELRLELRRLLLQVDPHQLRCDKRNEQEREDIAEHVGDGVACGYVCLLLVQHIPGKSELRKRT